MIPLSKPFIQEDDINEVLSVLQSRWLALGPYLSKFEEIISEYTGSKYAVAVNSGTSALHLILKALDPKPGEYMIVPSFTFISSANVALFEGVIPIFVDIDEETYNTSPDALEDLLIRIEKGKYYLNGNKVDIKKVKYFMGVDIFGQPLDWDRITPILKERNITIIEDSCEALGAEYKGQKVGNFGIAGAFAFYPNKQITTGEGGITVTNDEKIYKLAKSMRNQGRGEDEEWLSHIRLGHNYRMDEMSAALGYSQMKKIDKILEMRGKVASTYNELLNKVEGVRPPAVKEYTTKMSWFVYVVLLDETVNRDKVIDMLKERGIQSRNYFQPVHLQPFYRRSGHSEGELPNTEKISKRTLALPFYTAMTREEIEKVVDNLKDVLKSF
ncbi:MAG: DegT/DnrJ/EryC1/StrS family aminotransferase [Thermotogaceae bacterium]|nr:DegT/DnrJ/EryC1/StrS family aminotransferase [Thermotogaceae bacterium]